MRSASVLLRLCALAAGSVLLTLLAACETAGPAESRAPAIDDAVRRSAERTAVVALAHRFSDAANLRDGDAFAATWHPDEATWRIGPPIDRVFRGRDSLGTAVEGMLGLWDFFVQTPGAITVDFADDYRMATARVHVVEQARARDGHGNFNLSYYADTLRKHDGAWRYVSRRYRTTYQEDRAYPGEVLAAGR